MANREEGMPKGRSDREWAKFQEVNKQTSVRVVDTVNSLIHNEYDKIELEYDDDKIVKVIYKNKGVLVGTLNLGYVGENLVSVERE